MLPDDLRAELAQLTGGDPSAEATWVADAIRERLAARAQLKYLEERAARGSRAAFEEVLAKVPPADPIPGDEW
jgi:hypothetical protein